MASAGTIVAEPSAYKKAPRAASAASGSVASATKARAGRNPSDADDDRQERAGGKHGARNGARARAVSDHEVPAAARPVRLDVRGVVQ